MLKKYLNLVKNWLLKPYYFNPSLKFKFRISFFLGLFVFLFLYIFKPFYLSTMEVILLEYTLLIGIIGFLGTFFMLAVPPLIFKNYFNEDNWTLGRNIFLITLGIILIGSALWYIGEEYKEPYDFRKLSLFQFIFYTFLVTLIPLVFFIFINEKNVSLKRRKRASEFKKRRENFTSEKEKTQIIVYSDNGKEKIVFFIDRLVYITSQGNYVSFYLKKENDLKEIILRATLTRIAKDLQDYKNVIRCHKSYIINTCFVKEISGNARGYLLKSDLISFNIPVSRSFSKQSLESLLN